MSKNKKGVWLNEKPEFDCECTFVTASTYNRNGEPLEWDIADESEPVNL